MDFRPGFRLSLLNIAILLVGGIGALGAFTTEAAIWFAIAFVVGHFFLFCNVIRMARPSELIWATVFCLL